MMLSLERKDEETWYYKPLENMVTNLAIISQKQPNLIRFVDQSGYVFDRMTFPKTKSLHNELLRNGFTQATDGDDFLELIGLPETITDPGGESQPVYSSGKFWIA